MSKSKFASTIGLIAATVGSAVGLGNVWRFPAETQANGGSAFLLLYIICVLVLGIPVMLAEFSLGRGSGSDSIGAFRHFSPGTKWWIVGALAVFTSYLICCYYLVVAGWTLEYLVESITGGLYGGVDASAAGTKRLFTEKMDLYVASDFRPVAYTLVLVAVNAGVLLGGVQRGIERLSNVLMPMLFVILTAMCCITLTLPDASEGVRWFLQPDFSKITPEAIVNALGQAFFSLSLGMGILITYSSYYPESVRLGRTSFTVAMASLLVAVMTGLVIFPAVMSFDMGGESLRGATLVFVTLPEIFARLPLPWLWSTLFFVLLFVAALTSSVSIAEVSIASLCERFGMKRRSAVACVFLPMVVLSPVCALSFGSLSSLTVFGMTIFDFLDNVTSNIMLPLVSIGVCLYVGWFGPRKLLENELTNGGKLHSVWTRPVLWAIRYAAPAFIILIMVYNYL